ncbi:biotin carboxylase [Coccidioides immitis RMSCC 3703]|uniref:Biotin carboxylase n=1 Tax=Coccidioides immitis RMSCC 3703 TaxID=454286 RepID=A0A0J8TV91_COCIT|nr:biotin carboxylase [Coccidioides immitis RMSCC 3703]
MNSRGSSKQRTHSQRKMVPPARPIRKLLVANRGEIAVRILQAARELPNPVETYALYTPDDQSHCELGAPNHALALPSPASYMDVSLLVKLAKEHSIDTVHPGYGFLSESPEFAQRMWEEAGAKVIGPGWEVLAQTGDKLQAKELAEACGVPVLKAITQPTSDLNVIKAFAAEVGYPVMIKAVDGGGGRGIRLVRSEDTLQASVDRAMKVFVEKAAVEGYHHVEDAGHWFGCGKLDIFGRETAAFSDGFKRLSSALPALMKDRKLICLVIEAALRIANRQIKYLSLGTFEFLVNEQVSEFYFLEINPRLQVEHTITECITSVDLIIVTAASWDAVISKARRVLEDTKISGIKTNIDVLRAVIDSADFREWRADTQWLESNLNDIVACGQKISQSIQSNKPSLPASSVSQTLSAAASNVLLRKGDAWSIDLQPVGEKSNSSQLPHHLLLSRVLRNEFPTSLRAEIEYTTPATVSTPAKTAAYIMTLSTTSTSASALSSTHRLGDPNNQGHVILPISGKLIEMLVAEGDEVEENAVIAFVKQMKMEIEVRSPRAGRVTWVLELESEDGDDVPEGVLLAELEAIETTAASSVAVRGKL